MPPDHRAVTHGSQSHTRHHKRPQYLSPPPSHPPTRRQKAIRQSSFANLAKIFKFGALAGHDSHSLHDDSTGDDDEVDDNEEEEVDEEQLMWDAQAALVAHQPTLAMKRYTTAALPPHCSAEACLAIGNLLTRGRTEAGDSSVNTSDKGTAKDNSPSATGHAHHGLPSPSLAKILGGFFRPSTPAAAPELPTPQDTFDVAGNGWQMRKEGKRAVRNVETMGVAGGWFVLGLGWIVEAELRRQSQASAGKYRRAVQVVTSSQKSTPSDRGSDDEPLMMGSTFKARATMSQIKPSTSSANDFVSGAGSTPSPSDTVDTLESSILRTPESEQLEFSTEDDEVKKLQLVYDLLQPLLKLYRHGHIQANDPVFLPPITPKQLPSCLRPAGDLQKGRNAWALGGVVAAKLLSINALKAVYDIDAAESSSTSAEKRQLVNGVRNLANYILGMTSNPYIREVYFRAIATTGPCGLEVADEVVAQAEKRLDIIEKTPLEARTPRSPGPFGSKDGYPFPRMSPVSNFERRESATLPQSPSALSVQSLPLPRPRKVSSTLSMASTRSKRTFDPTPAKSTLSTVTPANEDGPTAAMQSPSFAERPRALETLRKVSLASLRNPTQHRRDPSTFSISSILSASSYAQPESEAESDGRPRWPALSGWTMAMATPPPEEAEEADLPQSYESENIEPEYTDERDEEIARPSTPTPPPVHTPLPPPSPLKHILVQRNALSTKPSSASLLSPNHNIATIDPALAAAELASALTKHVCCSVCAVKGVNFPECRKCGMRFCSRDCRIGEHAAGNGKRHVCGLWESRRHVKVQESLGVAPGAESPMNRTASPTVRAF